MDRKVWFSPLPIFLPRLCHCIWPLLSKNLHWWIIVLLYNITHLHHFVFSNLHNRDCFNTQTYFSFNRLLRGLHIPFQEGNICYLNILSDSCGLLLWSTLTDILWFGYRLLLLYVGVFNVGPENDSQKCSLNIALIINLNIYNISIPMSTAN